MPFQDIASTAVVTAAPTGRLFLPNPKPYELEMYSQTAHIIAICNSLLNGNVAVRMPTAVLLMRSMSYYIGIVYRC